MNKAILHLASISKTFTHNERTITVLNSITMDFVQGNLYAITGASGTGKSTLLHIIAGLDTPNKGLVFFNSTALTTLSSVDFSSYLNKSIGLVFQSAHMIKELSVLENVMLPGLIANQDTRTLKKKALVLLEKVGLSHKIDSPPGELSGGQQQRATLARALINEPAFLIADEPTGNLDTDTGKTMIRLILDCHQEWGMGVIISSHDPYIAHAMNTIIELKNGTITQQHKENALCFPQKKFSQKQYK